MVEVLAASKSGGASCAAKEERQAIIIHERKIRIALSTARLVSAAGIFIPRSIWRVQLSRGFANAIFRP